MITEIANVLKEAAKISDIREIKEISEKAESVIEPDIEIAKTKTLESLILRNLEKGVVQVQEANLPIQNKIDGLQREADALEELKEKYLEDEGYKVESEVYLRDENGNIVKDPVTGEARRIDFVVVKDGKVVDSVEVTSKTANKTEQSAKEDRIRESGGNYIRDSDGNLAKIPDDVKTIIERRD